MESLVQTEEPQPDWKNKGTMCRMWLLEKLEEHLHRD